MISVIVPAFNVERTIGACLAGLLAQSAPRGDYEIIVVDDGSTDGTRAAAEAKSVCVLTQANQGAAAARNAGARQARGEILLFLDADSTPDPGWVEAMTRPFVDASIAGVSGVKKTRQRNHWARFIQLEYDFKYDRMQARGLTDFVDSSTAGYRRDVFHSNGGFDTTLMEAEDTDLSYRLAERGYPLVLARDAVVYHTHPESLVEYLRRKYRYAIWRAVIYRRYPHKAAFDTRTPQSQKMQTAFAFALVPFLAAAWAWNVLWWAVGAVLVAFVAATLPFAAACWRSSRRIALLAPPTLLLSAYAGGAGALIGLLKREKGRTDAVPGKEQTGGGHDFGAE